VPIAVDTAVASVKPAPRERAKPRRSARRARSLDPRELLAGNADLLAAADANFAAIATLGAPMTAPEPTGRGDGLRGGSAPPDRTFDLTPGSAARSSAIALPDQTVPRPGSPPSLAERIAGYAPQVRACYERRLNADPTLGGRLVIELQVEAGEVHDVALTWTEGRGDRALERCVRRRAARWSFDADVTGLLVSPYSLSPRGSGAL